MGAVNLGTARIVVIVALVVVGVAVLANGFADRGTALEPTAASPTVAVSPPESASPSAAPTTPPPEVKGVPVQVFNGTASPGLGATVQDSLESKGYVITAGALDAPTKPAKKSIVYYRGGPDAAQNESNATKLAKKQLGGAKVAELDPVYDELIESDTQLVVVVGEDYAEANA